MTDKNALPALVDVAPPTSADRHDGELVAGRRHGTLLMFISCLPVLGAVLLAPVLPSMQDHFAGSPGAKALVPCCPDHPRVDDRPPRALRGRSG